MAEIDHREGDVMGTQEASIVPFKPNEQAFEFVHPGKGALGAKAALVDFGIEKSLTPLISD